MHVLILDVQSQLIVFSLATVSFLGDPKKQQTVFCSSNKAEYKAMTSACCEITWLRHLFMDLHVSLHKPASLYSGSQSAMHIMANPIFHE